MYLPKPYTGNFKITSEFNPERMHPITKELKPHLGIDIGCPEGTVIHAPLAGKISIYNQTTKDGKLTGYGHYLALIGKTSQGTEAFFLFGHLSKRYFESGTYVAAGTPIGETGNTGTSTGAHLHFETRLYNKDKNEFIAADPCKFFDFRSDEELKGSTFFS